MKANPMRGEAEFGKHKLVVDFNGWCVAEAATGLKTQELLRLMDEERLSFLELRAVVRSFLSADLTSEEVGDLIGEVTLEGTAKALAAAMEGFFPRQRTGPKTLRGRRRMGLGTPAPRLDRGRVLPRGVRSANPAQLPNRARGPG